jgi:hypothetical protein
VSAPKGHHYTLYKVVEKTPFQAGLGKGTTSVLPLGPPELVAL